MIVLTRTPILLSNISYLIASLKDDCLLFIHLAVVEVSGSWDPQIMLSPTPLLQLHVTHLRIKLNHFGYLY